MFTITENAKAELRMRYSPLDEQLIKLEFTGSCSMRLRVSLAVSKEDDEILYTIDDMTFIIPAAQTHYFTNKELDFCEDQMGFSTFELRDL